MSCFLVDDYKLDTQFALIMNDDEEHMSYDVTMLSNTWTAFPLQNYDHCAGSSRMLECVVGLVIQYIKKLTREKHGSA